jgi:hypothetical protein
MERVPVAPVAEGGKGQAMRRALPKKPRLGRTRTKLILGIVSSAVAGIIVTAFSLWGQWFTKKRERTDTAKTERTKVKNEVRLGLLFTPMVLIPNSRADVSKFFDKDGNVFPDEWNSAFAVHAANGYLVAENKTWDAFRQALAARDRARALPDDAYWHFAVLANGGSSKVRVDSVRYSDGSVAPMSGARLSSEVALIIPVGTRDKAYVARNCLYPRVAYLSYSYLDETDTLLRYLEVPPDRGLPLNAAESKGGVRVRRLPPAAPPTRPKP